MIVWSGQGYLVAAIVFVASLIMNFVVDGIYGDGAYGDHSWGIALALLISSACIWVLGSTLQKKSDQVVIDKETGREMVINRSNHSFFFIPMKFWAIPAFAGGIVILGKAMLGL